MVKLFLIVLNESSKILYHITFNHQKFIIFRWGGAYKALVGMDILFGLIIIEKINFV